jgi:polyisoprenoid-binding protein YceI
MSTTTPTIPTTGTWTIDGIHSTATFTVRHNKVATFRGHFHGISGALEDGVLSGEVQVENIDVGLLPMFKDHMLSADWFDVENHPTLSFKSTDLHAHDDHLHATGEITIKGVTKPVEIGGSVTGPESVSTPDGKTANRVGIDLVTQVSRKDFGVTGQGGAEDLVTIEVSLELVEA